LTKLTEEPEMAVRPVTIVTGASRGLGLALASALADRGHALVIDARGAPDLEAARRDLAGRTDVVAIAGDVADDAHRRALVGAARDLGGLDVLVNNAGLLGATPRPALAAHPLDDLEAVLRANVVAPLGLVQLALPLLAASPRPGRILNVTSDAAVEGYPGWGAYGAAKAALEAVTRVLAAEHPGLRVYAVDPGDMRTRMHQDAFPGEDISDRPAPEASVPGLLRLIEDDVPSGRHLTAATLDTAEVAR
jgi:NAD(P)-dependent dehydrogenase (short-subunit alcohol dehydrogenase family)